MSTSTTVVDMDIKPNAVTYAVFTVEEEIKDKEGNVKKETKLKATTRANDIAKAKADNTFLFEQSFSYDIPGTMAGISQLEIPDEEKVNIFRQGIVAKVNRGIVAALEEQDKESGNPVFQPQAGNFDARPYAAEESGRRGLSETEKAIKMLKNMSPEVQAQLLAMLAAQSAPATS